jgi:small basic protein
MVNTIVQRLWAMTLSVKIAVVDAYESLFGNSAAAIAAALKPAAFVVVMLAVIVLVAVTLDWPGAERLFVPVLLAATSAFAVAWHRRMLLNEVPARVGVGRLLRYAGVLLAFLFCWAFAASIALLVGVWAGYEEDSDGIRWCLVAPGVVTLYFMARFATLFPAIALDRRQSMAKAWRTTRGHGMRLWLGGWFAVLPMVILSRIINDAVWRSSDDDLVVTAIAGGVAALLILFMTVGIAAGYASSIFRQSGALDAAAAAPSA